MQPYAITAGTTKDDDGLIDALQTVLMRLRHRHLSWEQQVKEARLQFTRDENLITSVLEHLQSDSSGEKPTVLSISDEKLEAVRAYLKEVERARQADIAEALKLNSGTVSVAIRRLELDDEVERGDIEHGSRVFISKA